MIRQLELFPQLDATIIRAYRNLHTGQISLLDKLSGLVVGHCDAVRLVPHYSQDAVQCIVNQAGRERVLRERKKYVHAYVEGCIERIAGYVSYKNRAYVGVRRAWPGQYVVPDIEPFNDHITYNPYKASTFTDTRTGEPVTALEHAFICSDGSIEGKRI